MIGTYLILILFICIILSIHFNFIGDAPFYIVVFLPFRLSSNNDKYYYETTQIN